MARLRGRSKGIIEKWQKLVAEAEQHRDSARDQLDQAQIVYEARKHALETLVADLAPTPRQPSRPTVGKRGRGRQRKKKDIFDAVPKRRESSFGYSSAHPFVQPVQPAGASSSPSNGVGTSTPSLETPLAGAPDAAHASSGGGSE